MNILALAGCTNMSKIIYILILTAILYHVKIMAHDHLFLDHLPQFTITCAMSIVQFANQSYNVIRSCITSYGTTPVSGQSSPEEVETPDTTHQHAGSEHTPVSFLTAYLRGRRAQLNLSSPHLSRLSRRASRVIQTASDIEMSSPLN